MFFGFLKKRKPTGDRRKEERYPAEDEFIVDFDGGTSYLGSSRDISIHGVRFATIHKMRKGASILLNFRMPQGFPGVRRFSVKAKVVRVYKPRGTERFRAGCSLLHTEDQTKENLRQFIHWLDHKG